jgi:2-polyprenyl-6-methoxyphenol hydroxylase-like FAD-dependent oxidoreductase
MKICVAGAGIGGLTFIRALHHFRQLSGQAKDDITLIEKSSSIKEGVGIVLNPNGLEILCAIGLKEKLLPVANPIETIHINRIHQELFINMQEVWPTRQLPCSIPRKTLHTMLFKGLQEEGVDIRMNSALTGISFQDATAKVFVNGMEPESFDLVIGADGVHSRVREICFPASSVKNTGLFYFRFITRNSMDMPSHIWKTVEKEQGRTFGFIPLSGNQAHCFIQLQTQEYPCAQGKEEIWLKETIASWDPMLALALEERCSPIHAGFAYMVEPNNWYRDHVVLLGDSAHAVSPTLSEGGSLAMEDAFTLALALCSAGSIEEALSIYESARGKHCFWAYKMSLSQLNSLRRRNLSAEKSVKTDQAITTRLMAEMYKPFLVNYLPLQLQQFLAKANSNKLPSTIH